MYTPKISEELVPIIYRIGRAEKRPMTKVVDQFIKDGIKNYITDKGEDFMEGMDSFCIYSKFIKDFAKAKD